MFVVSLYFDVALVTTPRQTRLAPRSALGARFIGVTSIAEDEGATVRSGGLAVRLHVCGAVDVLTRGVSIGVTRNVSQKHHKDSPLPFRE